tara:strand:+ start:640 stop:1488 length:849 start_codon:yes stop_codon:yes gene_type:complete
LNSNIKWDLVIKPRHGWIGFNFKELIKYTSLIFLFVKRDFVIFYKQTILGPLWYIIQPLVNTIIFNLIFGKIAKLSTDGVPPFLFYMSGTVVWSYFSTCVSGTSNIFVKNATIFGKVYFPRITVPIAIVITSLVQLLIQFSIFIGFYLYFIANGANLFPNKLILVVPFIILQMAILSLGFGSLISALTAKYRDLTFAMTFFIQIWMYLTPIVYPFSQVPEKYQLIYMMNPMVAIVELFRSAFLGKGIVTMELIVVSVSLTFIIFILGLIMFSRTERSFIDTV